MGTKNRKAERRLKIKNRIRQSVRGTAERPRLSVFRSNREIYAQVIDDVKGVTLVAASSFADLRGTERTNKTEQAKAVGKCLAAKAKEANITTVVFDRNGYLYHGRVKKVADAARNAGLKF